MARRPVVLLAAALAAAGLVQAPAVAETSDRQRAFAEAAREFGVPEPVLLGVSYLQSRWDVNGATPSTAAGYGPMHLTDLRTAGSGSHHDEGAEDPRGDDARKPLRPEAPAAPPDVPNLQTLDEAARLTGTDTAALRADPAQNIRGGAALLARYQRDLGGSGSDPAAWYGAVARYSGATDTAAAAAFADEVFATIGTGADRVTDDGMRVRLAPTPVAPRRDQLARLGLRDTGTGPVECPSGISCEWIPAPYQQLPDNEYGNHDKANRPRDQKIDYIIIHDTEGYWDGVLKLVQDPTYVSWHYTLRSADGHIAQHVPTKDVAWHAGNWYVNSKSIGLEHEGFAAKGTWYTEAMYRTSAKLVRHLAAKYRIPLDRQHILGHDNVPGTTPPTVKNMHWDPGPYWDWAHYFDLLGAPLGRAEEPPSRPNTGMVTISPDFATNRPTFTGCEQGVPLCPSRGSTSVILRSEPRPDAPLLADIGLRPDGSPSTMHVSDIGSRVDTGQQYAVAEVRGDWTAVWYLGQKGWFHNPGGATAKPARGMVVTPKPGKASVPVYGRAYPEAAAYPPEIKPQDIVPLQYTLPAGQRYAAGLSTGSEYFSATTFDPANHRVIKGKTRYLQVQFGHRVAFVNADDVRVIPSFAP
ncbi:N-acetylmuramoyl-L-alanine amidase [Amycolatopsis suaedae]|uniref:N-acetylmuramoyl-L-alanine amidase n=1 Tax=Amycolatopsis suaedae TaxID=2510978 RepID=A0A4Q7JC13_9PSEU|nr:N-acetylmuramoyl-L-alanine amidase [Amycolatopsis suaedae]RZQ64053.1 N-acetylmuramoyl-L-alanine amidase [Amycolatopsis suaedae]